MRSLRSLALVPLAALAIAGCDGGSATDEDATSQAAEPSPQAVDEPEDDQAQDDQAEDGQAESDPGGGEETVEIIDFTFEPEELEVPVGTTVEWVQQDSSRHTVDFDDDEESGDLEEGDTYRRTFDEAGTYDYICFFHPRMTASVTVTE